MSDLPGFRWLPGMLDTDGYRVVAIDPASEWLLLAKDIPDAPMPVWWPADVNAPDFTDPLTALGLLVLVREKHNVDGEWAITTAFSEFARVWGVIAVRAGTGGAFALSAGHSTETEALKAALAAAPRKG